MLKRTMAEIDVKLNIKDVLDRMEAAFARRQPDLLKLALPKPRLVVVSKTKPVEMIVDAYSTGQHHFGENYIQELEQKSKHPLILEKCPNIKWHFIGNLQVNKINKVPNLYMVQSLDSTRVATALDKALQNHPDSSKRLPVLIQINSSAEKEKHGVAIDEALEFFRSFQESFPRLQCEGIMTIGAAGHDYATGPNPDFTFMMRLHHLICEQNSLEQSAVQVSMGMSADYEQAVEMGSSIVRVGSSIFGARAKKA